MKKKQRLFKLPSIYFIIDKEYRSDICGYDFSGSRILSLVEADTYHVWASEKDFNSRCKLFRIKLK